MALHDTWLLCALTSPPSLRLRNPALQIVCCAISKFYFYVCNVIGPLCRLLLVSDTRLPTYPANIAALAAAFVDMVWERSAWFRHSNLLIPFGNDFSHQNAQLTFKQMDALMAFVNANESYSVKYVRWLA